MECVKVGETLAFFIVSREEEEENRGAEEAVNRAAAALQQAFTRRVRIQKMYIIRIDRLPSFFQFFVKKKFDIFEMHFIDTFDLQQKLVATFQYCLRGF